MLLKRLLHKLSVIFIGLWEWTELTFFPGTRPSIDVPRMASVEFLHNAFTKHDLKSDRVDDDSLHDS